MTASQDRASPAPEVDYYYPSPNGVPGAVFDGEVPTLFKPLKIRNMEIPNKIGVSPMCTYSAGIDGEATMFHQTHYASFFTRGAGLTIIEASAVSDNGGLSPSDLGIWNDSQARKLKTIVDYAHANKAKIAIQIAHGGRKASAVPPYIHFEKGASKESGGWPENVVAPSPIAFREGGLLYKPRELNKDEIKSIVKQFGAAAKRAFEISGFDAVEIHGAHGYLINEFLSSTSNKRTDEYGGSFENRIRFLLEVIDEVRANVPKDYPVFLRISGSENLPQNPDAWTVEDSIKLAHIVADRGIDLIDVSSGGNSSEQEARSNEEGFQAPLARAIKQSVGDKLLVASVGRIERPELANKLLQDGTCDLVLIGRLFLKNPAFVFDWAEQLKAKIHAIKPYEYVFHFDRYAIIKQIAEAKERSKLGDKK